MQRAGRAAWAIWLLVGVLSLAVLAVGRLVVRIDESQVSGHARQQVESLARAAETALNRSFLGVDLMLAGLPELPGLFDTNGRIGAPAQAAQVLRSRVDQSLTVTALLLLDGQGAVVASANPATVRLGVVLPAAFVTALRTQRAPQLLVSEPVLGASTGEKVLYLGRSAAVGPAVLLAVAEIPVAALATLMAPSMEVQGAAITLETGQGALLSSVPLSDARLGRRHPAPLIAGNAEGGASRGVGRLEEVSSLVSVRPTLYSGVLVSAGLSEAEVQSRSDEVRWTVAMIGGIFIGLALLTGVLAQLYLSRLRAATLETVRARTALEEALASMDEGFLLWDADDRVLAWNERYLHIFPHMQGVIGRGVSIQHLAEVGARARWPDADDAFRQTWIDERMAQHRSPAPVFERRRPDGRLISIAERPTATGGIVAVYRDITQARAAAEDLERARVAADAASEAKSRFLATMSHEIRTPLNGILGMNALLLETSLSLQQRQYAETVRVSGDALLAIVDDVLDMSRLEAGGMALTLAPFDPRQLVGEVVALLGARASAKGLALRDHGPADPPVRLLGDAGRLRQVLINLIGNAIKFTDQGSVDVHSQLVPDGAQDSDCVLWTLSVRDTGIGIAQPLMATLFQRFTQGDTSASRRHGGSGLGLAICRQLVELMAGHIEVDSQVGQGSEFRVCVPLQQLAPVAAAPAGQDAPATAPTRAGGRPLRILVAEDNPVNQQLMAALLEQMGHACDLVANGREAVRQVQEQPYDLVLMDIQMPEMDGVQATQAIRQLPAQTGRLPIIAVTANVLPEQRRSYLAAGMDGHVGKPVDSARLRAAIEGLTAAV